MLIGITGKSGSGKTFVAEWLKNKLDAKLLKFDQISHEVVASNSYKLFVRSNISNDVFLIDLQRFPSEVRCRIPALADNLFCKVYPMCSQGRSRFCNIDIH